MLLERITLQNFRAYRGRQTIDLRPASRDKPIILVTGLNGAGKTTLLEALHLALYGKIAPVSRRDGRAYETYLDGCIYDGPDSASDASVEVKLSYAADGEKKTYEICRSWRRTGKGIREVLEVSYDGKPSNYLSEDWAQFIEGVLPSRLAPLFFFDGEKIETLADLEAASDVLSVAIHSLLGLDLVDQLGNDLELLERAKQREVKEPEERALVDELEKQVESAREEERRAAQECVSLRKDLTKARKAWRRAEKKFETSGGSAYEKRRELEEGHQRAQKELDRASERLRGLAGGLAPLLLVEPLLVRVAKQAERERKAQESRTLGSLLESRDTAVLEHLDKSGVGSKTLEKTASFLEQDRVRRRQDEEVEEYLQLSPEGGRQVRQLLETTLPDVRTQVAEVLEYYEQAREAVEVSKHSLEGIPEEAVIAKVHEARNAARARVEELEKRLHAFEESQLSKQRACQEKEKRLSSELHKRAKTKAKREDLARMVRHSGRVRETLAMLRRKVLSRHVDRIQNLVLDGFRQLLRKSDLVTDLTIDPTDFSLRLYGPRGNRVLAQHLSAGERQLLAISLLWGLARASDRPMPTLIDTPLGRLDSTHRTHLAERYFPWASHQVILLSTDQEISGEYLEMLHPKIGRAYLLEFDEESWTSSIQEAYRGNGKP